MSYSIPQIAKAISAAVLAGGAAFAAALPSIDLAEVITIAVAVIVAGAAVFQIPNAAATPPNDLMRH